MSIKMFIKISIYLLFSIGIIALILPVRWFPSFYDVRYMGVGTLAAATMILFLPKLIKVEETHIKAHQKNHAATMFEFLLSVVFVSNAFGDLGLYQLYNLGIPFDKILHFITPLLSVIILSLVLHQSFEMRPYYSIALAALTVMSCIIDWEFYEYSMDVTFHTRLFGVYGSQIDADTKYDIICGVLGNIIGTITVLRIYKKENRSLPYSTAKKLTAK
ncbi:MAG: hypothetical protein NT034_04530 [Candidatus Magasanikbacteria bacterium]|nr:hypothetical protein [Candidatus Magasanikbacteria bacterium]